METKDVTHRQSLLAKMPLVKAYAVEARAEYACVYETHTHVCVYENMCVCIYSVDTQKSGVALI